MCGRFLSEIQIDDVIGNYSISECNIKNIEIGEKTPGMLIPVVTRLEGKNIVTDYLWGIKYQNKNIFNARLETVEEKGVFKNLINSQRCLVPASCYFEWSGIGNSRKKYKIYFNEKNIISFGAIYGDYKDEKGNIYTAVIILTIPASSKISEIHPRMPLIIGDSIKEQWLKTGDLTLSKGELIRQAYIPEPIIKSEAKTEQITFFNL